MATRFSSLSGRRAIIDRRMIADAIAALEGDQREQRAQVTALLKDALARGRAEIARRLTDKPYQGTETAAAYAFLTDQVLRLAYDFVTTALHPRRVPTSSERLVMVAVGGYGRGEMALHSDVDVAFVTPWKPTGWTEQVIEAMLYLLWDLGLKVGHSSRSVDDVMRMASADHTIRTAILEMRYIWGDEPLYEELHARFWKEVVAGHAKPFAVEKLEERDERHKKMGDSRYVVEPNIKEGKGGLRDLHTLFWIGKYAYGVQSVPELVDKGLLTPTELRQFQKAGRFLWAVRCHLHLITDRPEERLTFEYQREIAERMRYANRPGKASPVERFMRHYFLNARIVGDLTGVFLAHLDEKFARRGRRLFGLPSLRRRFRNMDGFVLDRGRLAIPDDDFFKADPVRLIQLFVLADVHGFEIHPLTMRAAARDAHLIDAGVRNDPRANTLFLDVLTSPRDPETVLRWMNESGVFGRFVPDFGRVVAQMQFDMYHHYTVDEHSIRAIGLLARIEKGEMKDRYPLSSAIFRNISSRRVLYVAVLLHDIAKGRQGDHSILGADVARELCPRFGLTEAETETVAWLVRWHLLMSATAFKRDVSDPKTVTDFVERAKSMERLRLLLLLTVVDISAVGPHVWNSWKGQLLRDLFEAAEERLRLGHKEKGRRERVDVQRSEVRATLGWDEAAFDPIARRLPDSYWLAEAPEVAVENLRLMRALKRDPDGVSPVRAEVQAERGATLITATTEDQPGLFYRIAGAISLAGGNIIDARVHTTIDGQALDNFLVQDFVGSPFADARALRRLQELVAGALRGQEPALAQLERKPLPLSSAGAFPIRPAVFVDNGASNRYTVVEVNARDRPALLCGLAKALHEAKAAIRSAHIATYGERAVDVFYLTGRDGEKITDARKLKSLQARLLKAAGESSEAERAAAE